MVMIRPDFTISSTIALAIFRSWHSVEYRHRIHKVETESRSIKKYVQYKALIAFSPLFSTPPGVSGSNFFVYPCVYPSSFR